MQFLCNNVYLVLLMRLDCLQCVCDKYTTYTKEQKRRLFCFNHQRLILRRFKALSQLKMYIISFLNSYCNSGKGKTPYGLLRRGKQKAFSFPQIFYNKKTNNLITFMKQNINYFDLINIGLVVYD